MRYGHWSSFSFFSFPSLSFLVFSSSSHLFSRPARGDAGIGLSRNLLRRPCFRELVSKGATAIVRRQDPSRLHQKIVPHGLVQHPATDHRQKKTAISAPTVPVEAVPGPAFNPLTRNLDHCYRKLQSKRNSRFQGIGHWSTDNNEKPRA